MKLLVKRLLSYFPTKLPVGLPQFNTWADSIIELSGQYADKDSMVFALTTMIIHADAKYGSLPKNYFVVRLRKSAANQVASYAFNDIKTRQAEAAVKKQLEDTQAKEAAASAQTQETAPNVPTA